MFDFSNYSIKSKYHNNAKKLVVRKMKDGVESVASEEFVGLKPKKCSFLIEIVNIKSKKHE